MCVTGTNCDSEALFMCLIPHTHTHTHTPVSASSDLVLFELLPSWNLTRCSKGEKTLILDGDAIKKSCVQMTRPFKGPSKEFEAWRQWQQASNIYTRDNFRLIKETTLWLPMKPRPAPFLARLALILRRSFRNFYRSHHPFFPGGENLNYTRDRGKKRRSRDYLGEVCPLRRMLHLVFS